jgi:hypothetical protein
LFLGPAGDAGAKATDPPKQQPSAIQREGDAGTHGGKKKAREKRQAKGENRKVEVSGERRRQKLIK